ncbi:MAG: glycosyltransferase [Sulfurospirillaceae bacterium]|nr:glycosyltransferase [Sulfurospirillaceae bacterium]
MLKNKKLLFAISSLGLGHATRTMAVVNHFKKDNEITIISYGNALNFLKKELSGDNIEFIPFVDYPNLERGKGLSFYFYLLIDLIKTNLIIREERKYTKEIEKRFDFIFSDGRYGIFSKKIPSFLLSHQISFIPPNGLSAFSFFADLGNYLYFKNFNELFIPDFENFENSLAGKLSHPKFLKYLNYEFIGLLSSYDKKEIPEDIDYLFVISGYLKEHKDNFISKLIENSKKLKGSKVFVLGDTSHDDIQTLEEYDITIYPSVSSDIREEFFARAKVIISRTGYTTIMDLVELDKKAILFPTPNQSEQEYLAKFHMHKNNFVICEDSQNFDLQELILKLPITKPYIPESKTKDSLEKIEKKAEEYFIHNFFSIIIPAYNEAKYISKTLEKLSVLEYDNFEIIIVENGSSDNTFKIASSYKETIPKLKVYQSPKGVSKAKNVGLSKVSEDSNWVIFLDADTELESRFLKDLNNYLNKNKNNNLCVGTCEILASDSKTLYSKLWLKFYDLGHKLTQTSYSMQIAKTDIAQGIKFDEELNYSEDLKFIRNMQIFGEFFFFNTKEVLTSVRRFEKDGYLRTLIYWNIQAFTPEFLKKNKNYKSIR